MSAETDLAQAEGDLAASVAANAKATQDAANRIAELVADVRANMGSGENADALETAAKAIEDQVSLINQSSAAMAAATSTPDPQAPASALTLGPDSLPTPVLGQSYTAQLTSDGSAGGDQYSIKSGALPDGLSLAAGGGISGTPTAAGTFQVEIQNHDANGDTGSIAYTLEVADPAAAQPEPEPQPA